MISTNGDGWFSSADFSKGAIGDLDCVHEYRCLGSGVQIVSHSGSSKPRIRFSQQKFRVGRYNVLFEISFPWLCVIPAR